MGHSMTKHIARSSISKINSVSILPNFGETTEDLSDYVKPPICKKPDVIIAHITTNDFTKGVNTVGKVKNVFNLLRN